MEAIFVTDLGIAVMWRFQLNRKPWPIGMDISPDGIRMLQLKPSRDRLAVQAGAQWKPGDNTADRGLNRQLAVQACREILETGQFTERRVVSSIGMDDIQVKTIRMLDMPRGRLAACVLDKAQAVFDSDLSQSRLYVLGGGFVLKEDVATRELILLVVPKYAIKRRREMIGDMGLEVEAIEAEPVSIFRAYRRLLRRGSDLHATHVVIHVSNNSTLVMVAQGTNVIFLKRVECGGDRFTKVLATQLGVSYSDAERLRYQLVADYIARTRRQGLIQPARIAGDPADLLLWTVHDAVRDEVDSLVLEIGLCLRYCSTNFGCPAVERVTLTGENAWDPSLIFLLKERLGVRCEVASPLRDVNVSTCPMFGDRRGVLSDWASCMGLATFCEAGRQNDPESLLVTDMLSDTIGTGRVDL